MLGDLEVFSDEGVHAFPQGGEAASPLRPRPCGAARTHLLFVLKARSLHMSAEPVAPVQLWFLRSGIIILFYLPDSCFLFFFFFLAQEQACLLKMKKKKKM